MEIAYLQKYLDEREIKPVGNLRKLYVNICNLYTCTGILRQFNQGRLDELDMGFMWTKQKCINNFCRETSWKETTQKTENMWKQENKFL